MIGKRRLHRPKRCRLQRLDEELLGILVIEILAAETVNAVEDKCAVVGILLQRGAHFKRQIAVAGAVGITAVADQHGAHAAQQIAQLLARERAQHVERDDADGLALGAQPVGNLLGGLGGRVE